MIKRIICIFIIIAFTFCSVPVKAFALKDSDSFKLYSIPIKSNESIKDSIIGYYNQEDWFFSISDICTLTRATFEINDNIIKIKQGALSVNINIKNNTLSVGEEKTNFEIINYDKKYLVKPYALLKLLCANCMYIGEKNLLLIIMPSMTTYEAIQSNNLKSLYYNILEEGKGQFITRMTCSIFMDTFFDGLGNLLSRKETDFLESALFEVNKVDIENYNSLKTQKEDMIEKNTDTYNIISNIYNIETKLIGEIKDLIKEIDLKGSEKLLHYADMLSGLSNIGDKFITFSNIVVSAEERLNYNIDSYEIFSKTLTQENLSDVPGNYSSIINSSKNVSDKISSEFQAYYNATYDEMKKSYLNNIIDGSIKSLDKLNRSKSISSFLLAYDIGTSVTKILLPKKFKAYKADLNALYLSAVQNDICFPINYIYENLNKGFWNVTNTKRFIDMINLYNRISIAMFSNLKQSNEEFHMGYDNVKLDDLCNQAAKQTYVLYTCDPKKDICSLDDFKDYYNNDITKLIDIKKCKEYNSTLVVPIEDETTPSEIVEIPEVTTIEPKSELPEIVQAVLDDEEMWLNELNEMTYGYEGHMPKVGYNECWFQDIDIDGTPEFIVGGMGFQSDGIIIQVYNIYKYKNGSLQRIEVNGRTFSGEKEPYLELLWDGEEPHYGSGAFNNLLKVFKNNNIDEFLYTMEHKYDYTSDPDGGGVISFYVYNMNKDAFECDGNSIVYCSVDKNNIINGNYRVYNHDGEVDEQEFLKTYNSFFENLIPYKTTIKSIPCTKLSAEKSGYYDTMSVEQKKQALLSSYNAWSCKENSDAELPLSKFMDKLNSQGNNHFNISDYDGAFYPTSYDDCPTAITINVQSETTANILVEITNKNYTRYGRSEFSGNINSNPFTFEENDGFNNNCKFTLEFKDGKIYLTTKHIQLDSNAGWTIPELDKIELTKGNSENPPISDYDILSAVNKYLRENQSQLGVWLSDGNPYCLPEHISSNKTNWSCPINLSWESYSSNEIAGSYPHFAYVDKSSLKCTLTANYETVVEFDLNDYLK